MLRKICALILFTFIFVPVMSGCVNAASLPTNYDPYHLYPIYNDDDDEEWSTIYNLYGNNSELGFFYPLRDVSDASGRSSNTVAGPQWFATVYENYFHYFYYALNNDDDDDFTIVYPYLRTLGGELNDGQRINTGELSYVPLTVLADILDRFNYVLVSEPEPYDTWINRGIINTNYYDVYADPLESLCLVIPEGQEVTFDINFANAYARHFPFWFGWGRGNDAQKTHWWENYDSNYQYNSINEPVFCVIDLSTNRIYQRVIASGKKTYPLTYNMVTSNDKTLINNTSGATVYTVSGDQVYNSSGSVAYTFSGDIVYNANGSIAYTIEYGDNNSNTNIRYLCDLRSAYEQIELNLGDDYEYNLTVTPSQEKSINPGEYLNAKIRINTSGANYGSTLGYITFKQRATFDSGYSNFREASPIPIVVANVYNGNASGNPLLFDMLIKNGSDIVKRIKFTWDAQSDVTKDIGKFFMMTPYLDSDSAPVYTLETRITNRTGTRYELYRYDEIGSQSNPNRSGYVNKNPDYWKYDLTPDLYGTLPEYFKLDAHSQIAPGLVTVYKNNVGEGYRTLDTNNDTSESFRLYEYSSSNPKNLRLYYRRIAGMTPNDPVTSTLTGGSVRLQTFEMKFTDNTPSNSNNTENELKDLLGKAPAMISVSDAADVAPVKEYINSSAIDAFKIDKDAITTLTANIRIASDDETSGDKEGTEASKIALLPVSFRFVISRQNSLINSHWDELEQAGTSEAVLNAFARYATIWVRSESAYERDADLLNAINNTTLRGYDAENVKAVDCINAFTASNDLYLDFIALLADGKSIHEDNDKTAYVAVFKDDNVPYILIGDGTEGDGWHLKFYIAAPDANNDNNNNNNNNNDNDNDNNENQSSSGGSGGGGGCNSLTMTLGFAILLAGACFVKR